MRLIDADALTSRLKTIFCKECKQTFGCICCPVGDYLEEIKDTPTIEAEPVRHGHWIRMKGMMPPEYHGHYECSICKWHGNKYSIEKDWKYCPNCGAKMDE